MESGSHLKNLLQTQLASDASAIRYLPYCLSTLNTECFLPSSHLAKWTTRIHALIHSKEPGARWAGLCLAYKTSLSSQRVMIDMAQLWLTIAMPLLSRNEPTPVLKAAIRLLRTIFTTATDISEFQRQVCVPNVVKFTSSVVSVAENPDNQLKVMCMETLANVITTYPTAHRASSGSLSAFALRHLNGSTMGPTNQEILDAASRLYAVLPLTGGKVGATNLWRKSIDETLTFGWEALYSLRTTFPIGGQNIVRPVPTHEPQVAIPLNQDRLRCTVVILCNLLGTTIQRPVQVPLGNIIKYIISLLSCSVDEVTDGFIDPSVRSMEVSVVPEIWKLGCELLRAVTELFPYRLDPYSGRLFTLLAFQLDQKQPVEHKLYCLKAVDALLRNCHPVDSSIIPTRLSKAILPSITKILSSSTEANKDNEPSSSKSKNARKRARNYEGDEVFKVTRQVTYPTADEGEVALASLDAVHSLFRNPNLSSTMQSIIARLVVSLLVILPKTPWSSLSQDPTLAHRLIDKVQKICFTMGAGTTGVMSKTLIFVIKAALSNNELEAQRDLGILIHPRVPPLVRTMPHVESLSLFKAEESQEEADALRALKIDDAHNHPTTEPTEEDIVMVDHSTIKNPHDSNLAIGNAIATTEVKRDTVQIDKLSPPIIRTKEAATSLTQVVQPIQNNEERPNISPSSRVVTSETKAPNTITYLPVAMSVQEDEDEDEEMPAIDLSSDSEGGED